MRTYARVKLTTSMSMIFSHGLLSSGVKVQSAPRMPLPTYFNESPSPAIYAAICSDLSRLFTTVVPVGSLSVYLSLSGCMPGQGLISYSVATSPMMYELAFGLARTLFIRP